jgi:carbonic anhydrase
MKVFHSLVAASLVTPILGLHFPQVPLEPGLEPIVDAFAGNTEFSYNGVSGPLLWHSLDPEYRPCARDDAQSPSVIDSSVGSAKLETLNFPKIEKTKFKNLGHTVQVNATGHGGTLTFEGTVYKLEQFHFHTPSEHRLFDEYYPLEVHFVFKHDTSKMPPTFALNSWTNSLKPNHAL